MSRDWHAWYDEYENPDSSLSRRLEEVRAQLRALLATASGPVRLVSVCAGDGRDTLPVIEGADVSGVLVEIDPVLADRARETAPPEVDVRTADAGTTASYADACPADVFLACGVFGNISDVDIAVTIDTLPTLLNAGAHVIWTRGSKVPQDPTAYDGDPSDMVRQLFADTGFEEVAFVRPVDASYRVGVHRWPGPTGTPRPDFRMFDFV